MLSETRELLKDRQDGVQDGTLKVICFNGVRGVFDAFVELKQ